MTRISTLCAVAAALALSANGATAQNNLQRVGPPVVVRPPTIHLGQIPPRQQQQSFTGVHINIQNRRDKLQGASGGVGTNAQ